jgi:hypothetical protein
MTTVTLRISGVHSRAVALKAGLPFSAIDKGDVVVRSQLQPTEELNSHLVWLWGVLQHERRSLKTLKAEGATLVCEAKVPKGKVQIKPNGAEFLHLLGAELILEVR